MAHRHISFPSSWTRTSSSPIDGVTISHCNPIIQQPVVLKGYKQPDAMCPFSWTQTTPALFLFLAEIPKRHTRAGHQDILIHKDIIASSTPPIFSKHNTSQLLAPASWEA